MFRFRVNVLGFRFEVLGLGLELMFRGLGFRVDVSWFRVDVLNLDLLTICFFVKVNPRVINVFYPSLKMRVKVVSVNMKVIL